MNKNNTKADNFAEKYYEAKQQGNAINQRLYSNQMADAMFKSLNPGDSSVPELVDAFTDVFNEYLAKWEPGKASFSTCVYSVYKLRKNNYYKAQKIKNENEEQLYYEDSNTENKEIKHGIVTDCEYENDVVFSEKFLMVCDIINTINSIYRNRKTLNYAQLFFTEFAEKTLSDYFSQFNTREVYLKDYNDYIMRTINVDFADYILEEHCTDIFILGTAQCKYGDPIPLLVYVEHIKNIRGKTVSVANVSIQKEEYRTKLAVKMTEALR